MGLKISDGGKAIVDAQFGAVDEGAFVTGQIERRVATSSGSQSRPCWAAMAAGEASIPRAWSCSTSRRPWSVAMKPGETALQRMPRSRNSTAMLRANIRQAALLVL